MNSENTSFIKNFLSFFISKKFFINIAIAVGIFILIIVFTTIFLKTYTNHGQQFYTPDFAGLTIEQSLELADDKNVRIEIIDSVFDAPGKRGTIVDQTPPPDFLIKENRTIFLTLKAFTPKRVEMPDLRNISLVQAKSEIETYGLLISKLEYKSSKFENLVIDQMVENERVLPGTVIDVGTEITLVIGKTDKNTKTAVPDLKGLTKNEATLLAAENALNIGTVIFDASVTTSLDSITAKVWKHSPYKNKELSLGSEIDIWLTLDESLINE